MMYGEKLLMFRARYKLSQKNLAEILGVHVNMIGHYENNTSKPTKRNQIRFEQKMKEWSEKENGN